MKKFREKYLKCQKLSQWKNLDQKFKFQRCLMWTNLKWHNTLLHFKRIWSYQESPAFLPVTSTSVPYSGCLLPSIFSALKLPRLTWERHKVCWLLQVHSLLIPSGCRNTWTLTKDRPSSPPYLEPLSGGLIPSHSLKCPLLVPCVTTTCAGLGSPPGFTTPEFVYKFHHWLAE